MIKAGIKDLKNSLSRYLLSVKNGEDIIITERGRVIARIIQENTGQASLKKALQPLAEKGLIRFPERELNKDIAKPVSALGKALSEIVLENRR
jgi:prevent-host-death family protein